MGMLEDDIDYAVKCMVEDAQFAILDNDYAGIRDQDGWETLELTVRAAHERYLADYILMRLR
jgi:hypothetical protein